MIRKEETKDSEIERDFISISMSYDGGVIYFNSIEDTFVFSFTPAEKTIDMLEVQRLEYEGTFSVNKLNLRFGGFFGSGCFGRRNCKSDFLCSRRRENCFIV